MAQLAANPADTAAVDFSGGCLDDALLSDLSAALATNTHVTRLDISGNGAVTETGLLALRDALREGLAQADASDGTLDDTHTSGRNVLVVRRRSADGDAASTGAIADLLADGKIVALVRGRQEFGPRALGSRSILGDARLASMQSAINQKVKFLMRD